MDIHESIIDRAICSNVAGDLIVVARQFGAEQTHLRAIKTKVFVTTSAVVLFYA
ncbi:MAG TPA: hypothetical protein VGC14_17445 [Rhizobium sp.]